MDYKSNDHELKAMVHLLLNHGPKRLLVRPMVRHPWPGFPWSDTGLLVWFIFEANLRFLENEKSSRKKRLLHQNA